LSDLAQEGVMPATVTLTATQGKLLGKQFVFEQRTTCIIGRSNDCHPRIPNDEDHRTVSRHHCLLDINPPDIRVRDFGSRNGTYVNGQKIGQRTDKQAPEEAARLTFPEHDLHDGDLIQLGDTVFQVSVYMPAVCFGCGDTIPEGQRTQCQEGPDLYVCTTCRFEVGTWSQILPPPKPLECVQCGRDVQAEIGSFRRGDFLCTECRANPAQGTQELLDRARAGEPALRALQGFRIEREVGRGGMGAVYLLRHDATGERIALKVMLPRVAVDKQARAMFLREVENTQALNHPNVVRLRDSGCSRGAFFFTLEYCEGGSLERLRKERGGKLPVDEACALILQALDGLEYSHHAELPYVRLNDGTVGRGRGLVHRDLSPDNLLLSGSGHERRVKIADYGLAKAFDLAGLIGQTCTGARAGKPFFMPRQQVVNFKYARPEVDVWALAACLYCLLTGATPRDFPSGQDRFHVVLQTSAIPVRQRDASIPSKLAEVLDLALVDKPDIIFKSAADLKLALQAAVG
jgi:serine/threonine-protein kinase